MNGRFSPIQSPKRRDKTDHSLEYSDASSTHPSPPSYTSSSHQNHGKSKIYSNLMNFLDDATMDSSLHQQHHSVNSDHIHDDMSSISNSTLSPHRSGLPSFHSRSSRQYVWDESEAKDGNLSSSPSLFKPSYQTSHRSGASLSSNATSLKSNIEEVQKKVEKMKNELKVKNLSIKELQSELSRLMLARDKKIDRIKATWTERLNQMKDQNQDGLRKLNEFHSKITDDIQKITTRLNDLKEKVKNQPELHQEKIHAAEIENQRNRKRAYRQLESDERQAFEKLAASKVEFMQKVAADTVGPKLEQMVISGREKVNRIREEGEMRIVRRSNELRKELQNRFEIRMKGINERVEMNESNVNSTHDKRVQQAAQRHGEEIRALKEKFGQEMRLADESHDRMRTIHTNTHLEQVQLLKRSEQETVAALLAKQQQEIDALIQSQTRQLDKLRRELDQQYSEWVDSLQSRINAQQLSRESDIQERMRQEMVLEIENIKQKLREDAIQERQQFKKSHEDSIHEARLKYDQQLQSLHKSYSATETDCLTLRKEVETLSSRIFIKKSELHELKGQLNEEMKSLQLLDIGTSKSMTEDVNHLLFDYETTLEGNLEKKKEELRGWIQELKDSLERERERKEQEERNFHQQMRERKLEMTDEIARIESKIAALLKSRDSNILELRRSLGEAQERNRDLEEQLDEDRGKSIGSRGGVSSSTNPTTRSGKSPRGTGGR